MSGAQGGSLQNVLSISTAANNRYLLHFNSYNSLTQWTAGIRLAMFEHATLQEAYTGSLIAGKGRFLNNIKQIMERSKFVHDDWARVRFGAGTPWKRCWCVISPPDEKEYQKSQKTLKKSSYDRSVKVPKGDIKFYDTRKVTKKTRPIATITDAYAAYAIYPQSKPLVDQSTLVKLEGLVTIHTSPETTTEGFVFVMPEVHPAVTGFEMMLRWLFPVFDTFGLYGRPNKLIADVLDQRGLMFAMPRDRRYGYLDILDVSGLIHAPGSPAWSERQWRKEMKKLTSDRMNAQMNGTENLRTMSQRRNTTSRTSLPPRSTIKFDDGSDSSNPPSRTISPMPKDPNFGPPRRVDSAPPMQGIASPHKRSASDAQGYRKYMSETPSRLSQEASRPGDDFAPPPPRHGGALGAALGRSHGPGSLERIQSGAEVPTISTTYDDVHTQTVSPMPPLTPVANPPAFLHEPNSRPANQPAVPPELRRAHSNVDAATLYQMQDASRQDRTPDEEDAREQGNSVGPQPVHATRSPGFSADRSQGMASYASNAAKPRDPRQRLSTIEGSPYVGEAETFGGIYQGISPQTNGAARQISPRPAEYVQQGQRPSALHGVKSSQSISRKPVPKKTMPETPREVSSEIPSPSTQLANEPDYRSESLEGNFIDEEALARILENDRTSTFHSAASTVPDYASTVSSKHDEPKKSVERPRAGKLKTVGNAEMPQGDPRLGKLDTWQAEQQAMQSEQLPSIDFGPTYAYKPSSRPGTSGTMTPGNMGDRSRSRSQDRLRGSGRATPSGLSPSENHRHSYFGGVNTPSPDNGTPDGTNTPGNRHSIAWMPSGRTPGPEASRQSLTPEQWVQYRAAIAAQPQQIPRGPSPANAHNRVASSGSMNMGQMRKALNKTPPPFGRTQSGDWSKPEGGQRTPPSRPLSRGASAYLAQPSGLLQSQSGSLSAREQMHVARATGTPLLDMTNSQKQKKQQVEDAGLVGAIGAREREKAAMKANHRSSMLVDNAIRARQQQQFEAEAARNAQAQYQAQMQAQQQAAQQNAQIFQQQQAMYQQQQQMYAKTLLAQNQAPINYPYQQQQQQRPGLQTQSSSYYSNQPATPMGQPQQGYGGPAQQQQPVNFASPATYASNPYQAQQQQLMQQQGNRQSWYGAQQQQQQWQQGRR